MANIFLVGYANVAMGLRGMDSFQVGIAFSGGAVMAILFQMITAFFMDRYPAVSPKRTITVMSAVTIVMAFMLNKRELSISTVLILYMTAIGAEISLDTVIYTMAMELMNCGEQLNFGLCRGIGSISYAVIMVVSGYFLSWIGYQNLMMVFIVLQIFFIAMVLQIDSPRMGKQENYSKSGYIAFLNQNRIISVFLIGITLLSMCSVIIENFQINILRELGSDERMMGISRGLSALIEFPVMCSFFFLRKKLNIRQILIIAMTVCCIRSGIYAFAESVSGVLIAQGVQGMAFALYNLSSACFVNELISLEDVAKGQAVIGIATRGVGGIMANVLGGYLIARTDVQVALNLCFILTLIGAGIIAGVAIWPDSKNEKRGKRLC